MSPVLAVAWRFALVSAISFGGPSAVLPETHRLFVEQGRFLTADRFDALYSLAQISPGLNTTYCALFGWQIAGWTGALLSAVAMYGPSSVGAWFVERLTARHRDAAWMGIMHRALAPLTIALLLASGSVILRGADHNVRAVALTAVTVVVGLRSRLNPLWLLALGAVLGVLHVV